MFRFFLDMQSDFVLDHGGWSAYCYCSILILYFPFTRHYLPVLKAMPTQYIYEPWTAPESVQKAAKCIVGKDYPLPMVQHSVVSQINLERMRQVYKRLVLKSSGELSINLIHSLTFQLMILFANYHNTNF